MSNASEITAKLSTLQQRIRTRKGLIGCGDGFSVALHAGGRLLYTGADRRGQGAARALTGVSFVLCRTDCLVALLADGTLRATGRVGAEASFLREAIHVRRVDACAGRVAVLHGSGQVSVSGEATDPATHTADWPTVTDVCCGRTFTIGLSETGRVLVAGGTRLLRHTLRSWTNVAGIFTDGDGSTVYAITAEGRLLSTARLPRRVRKWRNLVYVAAQGRHIRAITATGQLLSTDAVAMARMRDTTPLATRHVHYIACAVSQTHTIALTRDGQVFAEGEDAFGQCRTTRFGSLFADFDEFAADRRAGDRHRESDERAYQVRYTEAERYRHRLACGARMTACIAADGRVLTSAGFSAAKQWCHVRAVACGNAHVLALHTDGCVSADGNDTDGCCDVTAWTDIKTIVAGKYHSLGLGEDGRVRFCGRNDCGQGDVTAWTDVHALYAADAYTVGVTHTGAVLIAGQPPFDPAVVDATWAEPTEVVVTATHMACLYADGRVRTTPSRTIEQTENTMAMSAETAGKFARNVADGIGTEAEPTAAWRAVRAIAAGRSFTVGLCCGGTVLAVGDNRYGQCETADWRHIVAIGCGDTYTVGLTADGRVLTAGRRQPSTNTSTEHASADAVARCRNILAVQCGPAHTVALTRDGQVVASGADDDRQCSAMMQYTLFRDVRQLYGYGQYRKAADCGKPTHDAPSPTSVDATERESGLLPFAMVSAELCADADRISACLTGSDRHLSVLTEDGTVTSYVYETGTTVSDSPLSAPVTRLLATRDSTLILYADGRVRERCTFSAEAPTEPLPNRLGDSPFYRVRAVACGEAHRSMLMEDGTVRSLGDNARGQCDTASWSGIAAIAAGQYHTVGLRADGTVVATGARRRDSGGRARGMAHLPRANPCAVEDWTGVSTLVCAADVTLGLTVDGRVLAAGSSHYGQGRTRDWRGVVSVATSGQHTVALFADGHVEAIGLNQSGECRTEDWRRVVQIAVLPELTLGLCADGHVLAAGRHHEVLNTLYPVRAMACFGTGRQVFVMADGTLRLHTRGSEYLPAACGEVRVFTPSVSHSIRARCMPDGQLSAVHRAIQASFAVGMAHTVSIGRDGQITVSGSNEYGQGDIAAQGMAVRVAAGAYHTAAILPDGRVAITGRGGEGQCDAATLNRELYAVGASVEEVRTNGAPSEVGRAGTAGEADTMALAYGWQQIACGTTHTVALRTDGRVYAVGANPDGRCDTRQWRNIVSVACGIRHTVALMQDGRCVATGDDRYGQCAVGRFRDAVAVAAGEFHTVALRADGRVEAVGDNRHGQCRVDDLRAIIAVACLPEATLCLGADGHVTVRGEAGEVTRAIEGMREIVALSTCEYRVGLLTVDRRLIILPR